MELEDLPQQFEAYYKTFPHEEMHDLKWQHTCRVVQNATTILKHEPQLQPVATEALYAAWLHDLGRFKQFEKYHTFSDRVSVNHALMSCAEILRLGWCDNLTAHSRNLILKAIELHNFKSVPTDLSSEERLLAHLVRDADKLDIFSILDTAIQTDYLPSHPEIYWNLPFSAPPSDKIVMAIEQGIAIDYADIKSFADFIFIQIGWLNNGLYFNESYHIAAERKEIQQRQDYLISILPEQQPLITYLCNIAENTLKAHLNAQK